MTQNQISTRVNSLSIEIYMYHATHNVCHKYNKRLLSSMDMLRKTLKPPIEKQVKDIFTEEEMYVISKHIKYVQAHS